MHQVHRYDKNQFQLDTVLLSGFRHPPDKKKASNLWLVDARCKSILPCAHQTILQLT